MKKRRRRIPNWHSREFQALGSVGVVLLDSSPENTFTFEDICLLADVTVEEAWMAILDFARTGGIRVKNELPLRFYGV